MKILEELLEAQSHAYLLGLKLGLRVPVLDGICASYSQPRERFLQVLIAFTQQVERPAWRAIVDALRSPALNLMSLARRVEAAHFPDPTAIRDVVPETSTPPGMIIATRSMVNLHTLSRSSPSYEVSGHL